MARQGLRAYAGKVAAAGRNGDTELAHLSPDEIAILISLQGHRSINPETGLPEFFSLKKILKGVAKAAGALAGGYFGGPAGAAVGAGAVSKLLGDSTSRSLTTGLLAGLGSWGAQQTGIGDIVGGGFSSGADLLGQQAADAGAGTVQTASATGGSGGGGMSLSAALPLLGIGAAALGGAGKPPKTKTPDLPPDQDAVQYEPLDRTQLAYQGDPYSYGQFDPEFQYYNEVNPDLQPLAMAAGGRVYLAEGGMGGKGHGSPGGDRSSQGGGTGRGGDTRAEAIADKRASQQNATAAVHANDRGVGAYTTPTGRLEDAYNPHMRDFTNATTEFKNRSSLWDALDFIAGPAVNVEQPEWSKIGTYSGGTWHTGTSVPGVIGALGGMFSGVPMVGGALGQWAGDQLGIGDVLHGGYSDLPDWAKSDQTGGGIHGPQGGGGDTGKGIGFNSPSSPTGAANPIGLPAPSTNSTSGAEPSGGGSNGAARTYVPSSDPYNYGQFGPEHNFFLDELNMRGGGGVSGPGDGQSDDIPAMLSNGEYVMDAETVSSIGNGSTEAGAKKLDAFRHNVRKHKRGAKKTKIPPKTKGLGEYMRRAA